MPNKIKVTAQSNSGTISHKMDRGQTAYLGKIAGIYGEVDNSLLEKGTHKTFHRSLSLLNQDTVFAPL